jgi:hypothetical protein
LHTVVFVLGVSMLAGLLVIGLFRPVLRRWWRMSEHETVNTGTLALFVTGGFFLGGMSHLVGDAFGADRHDPIRPLWPFIDTAIGFEIAHFASPWLNAGLLVLAPVLHALAASVARFPIEHRFRDWVVEIAANDPDQSESV